MKPIAYAFPVLPGKTERTKQFMESLRTKRVKEFAAWERKTKTTKEAIFLFPSPQGDMLIDYFECTDPKKSMEAVAKAKDKFAIWIKGQFKDLTGLDMNVVSEEALPETLMLFGY